jgi:hypothetical protein
MSMFSDLKTRLRKWKLNRRSPSEVFSAYYRNNKWGDPDSRSGKGSNLRATQDLRPQLPPLFAELGVKSLVDLPCGDFFWMQHVDLSGISYLGGDIVPELIASNKAKYAGDGIEFAVIDLITGPIPKADLIFVRDCLVHLSHAHVAAALANIQASGSSYLLTTLYPSTENNDDIVTGQWRALNLTKAPFNLPEPKRIIAEGASSERGQGPGKMLGLWEIKELTTLGAVK